MLCYKDKTFCPFYDECSKGAPCRSALTEEVKRDAILWWGNENAPICIYSEYPACFKEKN